MTETIIEAVKYYIQNVIFFILGLGLGWGTNGKMSSGSKDTIITSQCSLSIVNSNIGLT